MNAKLLPVSRRSRLSGLALRVIAALSLTAALLVAVAWRGAESARAVITPPAVGAGSPALVRLSPPHNPSSTSSFDAYVLAPGIAVADRPAGFTDLATWDPASAASSRFSDAAMAEHLRVISALLSRIDSTPSGHAVLDMARLGRPLPTADFANNQWAVRSTGSPDRPADVQFVLFPDTPVGWESQVVSATVDPAEEGVGVASGISVGRDVDPYFAPDGTVRVQDPAVILEHELFHAAQALAGGAPPPEAEVPIPARLRTSTGGSALRSLVYPASELLTNGGPVGLESVERWWINYLVEPAYPSETNPFLDLAVHQAAEFSRANPGVDVSGVIASRSSLAAVNPTETVFARELGVPNRAEYSDATYVNLADSATHALEDFILAPGVGLSDLTAADLANPKASAKFAGTRPLAAAGCAGGGAHADCLPTVDRTVAEEQAKADYETAQRKAAQEPHLDLPTRRQLLLATHPTQLATEGATASRPTDSPSAAGSASPREHDRPGRAPADQQGGWSVRQEPDRRRAHRWRSCRTNPRRARSSG